MTKNERAELYQTFIKEEGYVPKIDDDGDIVFKYEGRGYIIILDDDEEYFRLVFPNFWSIETEDERTKVMVAALNTTSKTKVAKVFPVRDNVWASVELFCSPPESFRSVFNRSMSALQSSVDIFVENMRG
jgi:hypothetical protein